MNSQVYIQKKNEIQEKILEFLDSKNKSEEDFTKLIKLFDLNQVDQDYDFKMILSMILRIANNYRRIPSFFDKIEKILIVFKDKIKQIFTNDEILIFFISNKRLISFLVTEEILYLNCSIETFLQNPKFNKIFYNEYLDPKSEKNDDYYQKDTNSCFDDYYENDEENGYYYFESSDDVNDDDKYFFSDDVYIDPSSVNLMGESAFYGCNSMSAHY